MRRQRTASPARQRPASPRRGPGGWALRQLQPALRQLAGPASQRLARRRLARQPQLASTVAGQLQPALQQPELASMAAEQPQLALRQPQLASTVAGQRQLALRQPQLASTAAGQRQLALQQPELASMAAEQPQLALQRPAWLSRGACRAASRRPGVSAACGRVPSHRRYHDAPHADRSGRVPRRRFVSSCDGVRAPRHASCGSGDRASARTEGPLRRLACFGSIKPSQLCSADGADAARDGRPRRVRR
jgi:hypothetical protein